MNAPTPRSPNLAPITLWRHPLSGHCHRVELFLNLLGLPYTVVDVDFMRAEQKSAAFLARNPFGEVPVIQDGELTLADSNAILVYLAHRYDPSGRWLPNGDAEAAARIQRWFSVAAGALAYGPAAARVAALFGRPREQRQVEVAHGLFALMERQLDHDEYLAGPAPTLADIAMYSYTAHAPEGGVALDAYPRIGAWLARIEALPGFVGMLRSALPVSAAA